MLARWQLSAGASLVKNTGVSTSMWKRLFRFLHVGFASGRFKVCVGCRVAFLGLDVHIAARNHLSGVCVDQRAEDPFRVLCESVEHVQPPLAAEYRVFPCAIVLGCKFVEGVCTEPE